MTLQADAIERAGRSMGGTTEPRQTSVRRVRDILRASISSGLFFSRDGLSEEVLMRELEASRNSVREALRMLSDAGLVERRRHSGTTVSGSVVRMPLGDDVPEREGEMRFRWLDERTVPASGFIARTLQTDDDLVAMIDHLYILAGQVIGVRALYHCLEFHIPQPGVAMVREESFLRTFGRELGKVATVIEATASDAKTARLLGIEPGSAVIVRQQTLFDCEGTPRAVEFSHFRGDRVSLTHEG